MKTYFFAPASFSCLDEFEATDASEDCSNGVVARWVADQYGMAATLTGAKPASKNLAEAGAKNPQAEGEPERKVALRRKYSGGRSGVGPVSALRLW